MSDWKSRAQPVNTDSDWKSRAQPAPMEEENLLGTLTDKFAQGGAMGFADEASGGVEALGKMAGLDGLGGKLRDIKVSDHGPTTDWEIIKHAYMNGRDRDRATLKRESEDSPIISGAAELAGGLMSPANKLIPKGMNGAKTGAIVGAEMGLGNSEAESLDGIAADTIEGAGWGTAFGMGGDAVMNGVPKLLNKGANKAKEVITNKFGQNVDFTPIENKEAVISAAKNLGIDDIPKALLTNNQTYQDLESGLSQSGSLPAKGVRDQYNSFFDKVKGATGKISELRTPESEFAIGQNIQKGLADQVNALRAPVTEMYKDLTPQLQKIPVDKKVVTTAFGALKRDPLFQTADGKAMLEEYKNIAMNQPELASLKEWRSTLSDSLNGMSSGLDENRIEALRKTITSIRDNSINATKAEMPKRMHGEVDNFINQVALADAAHASNVNDVNSIKGLLGNREFKSPVNFLSRLSEAKEGDLAERASNLDITSLRNMKDKFPDIFEKAKTAKINDMIQRASSSADGFKDATFLKQYNGMDKELKELIFNPEMQSHIESLKTLKGAIPDKLGPSGTPKGTMMMEMLSPRRNAMDFGIKKALDESSKIGPTFAAPAAAAKATSAPALNSVLQFTPKPQPSAPASFQRAADQQNDSASNFKNTLGKDALLAKTQGSKYGQVLQNAAAKGDDSLNAAHYVLSQRDADYRKQIEEGE